MIAGRESLIAIRAVCSMGVALLVAIAIDPALAGMPVRLAIVDLNAGTDPQASVPFEIDVQARDGQGEAAPVSSDSLVTVVIGAGTG